VGHSIETLGVEGPPLDEPLEGRARILPHRHRLVGAADLAPDLALSMLLIPADDLAEVIECFLGPALFSSYSPELEMSVQFVGVYLDSLPEARDRLRVLATLL